MPFDLPIFVVSFFVSVGAGGVAALLSQGRRHRWIWAVGGAAIYLAVFNFARRIVYDDVPHYSEAAYAYDRGVISFNELERAKSRDVDAGYKSIGAGGFAALLLALVGARTKRGPREEDAGRPQIVGSACVVCAEKIRLERNVVVCPSCNVAMHVACKDEHRHASQRR